MHFYPEDTSQGNLNKLMQINVCPECGRAVRPFLDSEKQIYLACSSGQHEGIAREYTPPTEDYRTEIIREVKLEQEQGRETSTALAHVPKQGQLTQPQATTVLNLIYPKASSVEIERCAIFCHDFGLHPLANEVYLIPFKGVNVMVVGIAASRKMAHALKGDFSFLENSPRAATEEEIIEQYGKDSDEAKDNIISITKLEGVGGNKAIGFGLYPKKESPYGMDKGNTRRNMANIRSERQGIDRLPGKAMPRVEVVDIKYAEVDGVGKVDKTTGEIEEEAKEEPTEGEFREVAEEDTKIPTPEESTEPEPQPEAKLDETPVTKAQIEQLKKMMADTGMDVAALGQYCINVKGWRGIRDMKDLKKWQFTEIMVAFEQGKA